MTQKLVSRVSPALSGQSGLTIPVGMTVPSSIAGTDFELPIFNAMPFVSDISNGNDVLEFSRTVFYTVKAVTVIGDAAMTGATATATTLALTRYDAAGANAVTVASFAFITGQNLVAFAPFVLTLSTTAANLNVLLSNTLTIKKTHASTGTATPNLLVIVDLV